MHNSVNYCYPMVKLDIYFCFGVNVFTTSMPRMYSIGEKVLRTQKLPVSGNHIYMQLSHPKLFLHVIFVAEITYMMPMILQGHYFFKLYLFYCLFFLIFFFLLLSIFTISFFLFYYFCLLFFILKVIPLEIN